MPIISKLKAVLSLDNKDFKKGLDDSKQQVTGFSKSVGKLGGVIAGAFSVGAVVAFGKQMVELGHTARNVDLAFKTLGISLESLRQATGRGIDDIRLQQLAIQARNLGLPVQKLATYFEFATKRAGETGESVEYLVNSIVTGIGRKSVLILDNLGISSVRLQEEFERTGDFAQAAGDIIQDELGKSVLTIDQAVSGVDRLTASWSNFLVKGQKTEDLNKGLKALAGLLDWVGDNLETVQGLTYRWLNMWSFGLSNTIINRLGLLADGIEDVNRAAQKTPDWIANAMAASVISGGDSMLGPVFGQPEPYQPKGLEATDIEEVGGRGVFDQQRNFIKGWENSAKALEGMHEQAEIINMDLREMGEVMPMAAPTEEEIQQWKAINNELQTMGQVLSNVTQAAIMAFADTLVDIFEGKNILDAFADFIRQMGNYMAQYGALLIAQGVAQKAFESATGPAKIAAGAALLALGLAVSAAGASINRAGSAGSGSYGSYSGGTYGAGSYDYSREVVLVARGPDLVAVLDRQTLQNNNNG